jgi:hypothetical protein
MINHVFSVLRMNLPTIYFLIVLLLNKLGMFFLKSLDDELELIMNLCLSIGFAIRNLGSSVSLLQPCVGALKVKKLAVFPGCCLVGYEDEMAIDAADALMLENPDAGKRSAWIRRCPQRPGKESVGAGENCAQSGGAASQA